ncbi:ATP-binding protein [Clostridium sp. A1-XYC3]|uniref:ATP-binding protein n=2 Tax=Clostridium tanneri TaxID=3037988 RepID=A0ABU4JTK3_9CLOT|nr:ATP-binding protein [Clostridium sp. A1-XYC3]MDW8801476.1 ATP-binding protein [Clostridium sp. A1-XYC3]
MGKIEGVIQRVRKQIRENGQAINHQNQESYQTQMKMSLSNHSDINKEECPACGGAGFVIKKSSKYQDTIVFCQCREMDKALLIWKNSGLQMEKNTLTFANYKPYNEVTKKAKNTAIEYFKQFNSIRNTRKNSIAFLGQVGSGKSHLTVALGVNLLSKGIKVVYMSYRDEILKIKQNILDEDYYARFIGRYKNCEVLLIDDLYKGKINESDINIIFEIINYRYMNKLPIIISSEFNAESLLSFDEGVGSRIIEMCKNYIVQIEGKENNYRISSSM